MSKALAIFGAAVSVVLALVFAVDFATNFLKTDSNVTRIGFLLCAGILGYLSYVTYREVP